MRSANFEVHLLTSWFSEDRITIQQSDYSDCKLDLTIEQFHELIHTLIDFSMTQGR